jgi:hypothetical protein
MRIRDWLGIDEQRQKQVAWLMELGLLVIVGIGVLDRNTGILVNAAVGLAVTQIVPILERDYGVPMDPGLTLWITSAVFLHALGTIKILGYESFYRDIWWWDHLTHSLSASVVAGAGYATVRAISEHSDEVHLPPRFVFVFILTFVMAFGVLWEVLEFAIAEVAAVLGTGTVLTQYGLTDSLWDLVFDTLGAVVVAIWGTAHLLDVSGYIERRLEERAA